MKRTLLTLLFSGLCTLATMAQAPLGMNYQAVIRNSTGEVVANQQIGLQLSVLQGSSSGTSVYSETFTPTTNEFGLVNVILGQGKSKSGDYSAINWSTANYYLKVELDLNGGSSYQTMGVTQLLSVPYANFAFSSKTIEGDGGNATISGTLQVVSDGTNSEEVPIFQVKNSKGETVFAVYENGVEILIDETSGAKTKGAFAISGKTTTKGTQEILTVTPELTQIYVDEPTTKTKGGFAISGRTTTKEGETDILTVTPSLTQVFVEETTTKTKGGFAISGRTTTKSTGTYDVFTVVPERTDVYVKPSPSKNSLPIGFSVSGLDVNYEPNELFSISELGTYVATVLAVKPKVSTGLILNIGQTSASSGGTVVDNGGSEITTKGIIYYLATMPQPTLENALTLAPSEGGVVSITGDKPFEDLYMQNLTPNTSYKVRAFATNNDKLTGFGDTREFKTLRGTKLTINVVTDSAATIENAMVTLWPETATEPIVSGPSGTHTFSIVDGYHTILIEAEGYLDFLIESYNLSGDQTETYILESTELPKVIFTIKNQHGVPVEGVGIDISGVSFENTNALGNASFFVAAGTYSYTITPPQVGFEEHPGGTVDVTPTPTVQYVNVTINEKPKVEFNVKDPDGNPMSSWFSVFLSNGVDEFSDDVSFGKAVLYDIPAGTWDYSIGTDGMYPEKTGTIEVLAGVSLVENVMLANYPSEYTVVISVVQDTFASAIDDAKVTLFAEALFSSVKYTGDVDYNEETGEATFYNVPASDVVSYSLSVEKEGYISILNTPIEVNRDGTIVEPGVIRVQIPLQPDN